MRQNILLVEPDFPFSNKSKHKAGETHKNFVPIGLLKFGALYRDKGDRVELVRGEEEVDFLPDKILVTSLFTYWSRYVWDCIKYYRKNFPNTEILLGGIYATLHADKEKFQNLAKKYNVNVSTGINSEAEKYLPDYSLLHDVPYHATHMMRGCIRRCKFCGTWRLEPKRTDKTKDEIIYELTKVNRNRVIFYDNNMLSNRYIKEILRAFVDLRINERPVIFESQSGFDGRLLENNAELAELIKKARFQNVRIAWDNSLKDKDSLKKQIDLLVEVGYPVKDISVFMIYNFDIPYDEMLEKLKYCQKWGVQITDCRYRPLDLDYDDYKPHMRNGQPDGSFYIHKNAGWTDSNIRAFRRRVRRHNIWIRYAKDKGLQYDKRMEKWSAIHNTFKFFNLGRPPSLEAIENGSVWKERVKVMDKIKNFYKKNAIEAPDFSNIELRILDDKLKKIDEFIRH